MISFSDLFKKFKPKPAGYDDIWLSIDAMYDSIVDHHNYRGGELNHNFAKESIMMGLHLYRKYYPKTNIEEIFAQYVSKRFPSKHEKRKNKIKDFLDNID
jgi:hypothetical protein